MTWLISLLALVGVVLVAVAYYLTRPPYHIKLLKQRIRTGAALLDLEYPGWHDKIDSMHLDLADQHQCVLGQLYGDFGVGARALNLSINSAMEHGFLILPNAYLNLQDNEARLTELQALYGLFWHEAVLKRKGWA